MNVYMPAQQGWSALFWMNWSILPEDEIRSLYLRGVMNVSR